MMSEPTIPAATKDANAKASLSLPSQDKAAPGQTTDQPGTAAGAGKDLIRIKRTYNFAGKVHTEEKLVARDSAEARLYLASNPGAAAASADENQDRSSSTSPKRLPRKAFRSHFEPVPDGSAAARADLSLGVSDRLRARETAGADKATKLNTVEKSRMDWAGFVDKEGIKDELQLAGKSKDSFAARQDFLMRSEARREEDARRVRVAGRAGV